MKPMLAMRGVHLPADRGWVHEVKWDGIRALAESANGGMRVFTRSERDVTEKFPSLAAVRQVRDDALLDGEIVALVDGKPSFGAVLEHLHGGSGAGELVYMIFDLLRLDEVDLTGATWTQRRRALELLRLVGDGWRLSPTYDDGRALMEATLEQGLEGVVSKDRSSTYVGRRSDAWLKFPHRHRESYVVGGWRAESGSPSRLGALLLGTPTARGLVYRGRTGSGLAGAHGERLRETLAAHAARRSPFVDDVPAVDRQGTRWVAPVVVVDVESLGGAGLGRLRQSTYHGMREDLAPDDLVGEDP